MTSTRRFCCDDLFRFSSTNLDVLTETYHVPFYLTYLSRWPDMCAMQESPSGKIMSYMIGKAEGKGDNWHGHVSAVTVAPEFRRLGLAKSLMLELERVSDRLYRGSFVDLFVRVSNTLAITMYQKLGYVVYRRILGYYSSPGEEEDGFDMRKAMSRDPEKRSMVPLKKPVRSAELL